MAFSSASLENLSAMHSLSTKKAVENRLNDSSPAHALLAGLPVGVVIIDGLGVVTFSNSEAQRLLEQSLVGELWRNIIASAFTPRKDDGHEVSLFNGKRVKLSISSSYEGPGQIILLTDLTETRKIQERSSHLRRLSSLGKMVASVAHQVRTPLAAATLYAANLKNPALSSSARLTFVDRLLGRLKDLENQVNDMLLFAKSDQQVVSVVDLQQLLEDIRSGCDVQLASHQVEFQLFMPKEPVYLLGNPIALNGAIQNLVTNSLQALPRGGQLSICLEAVDEDKLDIHVKDNGPGIEYNKLEQIFEPFFTTKSQGTGLGLAVVKTVIQSHKGTITVTSDIGKGTCFTISLPRYHDHEKAGYECSKMNVKDGVRSKSA